MTIYKTLKINNGFQSLNSIFLILAILAILFTIWLTFKSRQNNFRQEQYQPETPYAGQQLPDDYK